MINEIMILTCLGVGIFVVAFLTLVSEKLAYAEARVIILKEKRKLNGQ